MPHHDDLSPWMEMPAGRGRVLTVGFLDVATPYATGDVSREFFARIIELLVDAWQPFIHAGCQPCTLCRFTGGPSQVVFEGQAVHVGNGHLFVPGADAAYVAPTLIAHYVDAHGYCPPPEFQQAVMGCPEMRSVAYLKAILSHGLGALTKAPR